MRAGVTWPAGRARHTHFSPCPSRLCSSDNQLLPITTSTPSTAPSGRAKERQAEDRMASAAAATLTKTNKVGLIGSIDSARVRAKGACPQPQDCLEYARGSKNTCSASEVLDHSAPMCTGRCSCVCFGRRHCRRFQPAPFPGLRPTFCRCSGASCADTSIRARSWGAA